MHIFLDDQPFELDSSAMLSIADIRDCILERLKESGRLIATLQCDGQEVCRDNLEGILAQKADEFERIEFFSGKAGDLVTDALAHVQALLMETESIRTQAAEHLATQNIREASEEIRLLIEAWRHASDVVSQTARLAVVDLTTLTVEGHPLADVFPLFSEQLKAIKQAFESNDMVYIQDFLTYEAAATTERWIQVIEQMKGAVPKEI